MATMPTNGPKARKAKAHRQPTVAFSEGMRRMVIMVRRKPRGLEGEGSADILAVRKLSDAGGELSRVSDDGEAPYEAQGDEQERVAAVEKACEEARRAANQ